MYFNAIHCRIVGLCCVEASKIKNQQKLFQWMWQIHSLPSKGCGREFICAKKSWKTDFKTFFSAGLTSHYIYKKRILQTTSFLIKSEYKRANKVIRLGLRFMIAFKYGWYVYMIAFVWVGFGYISMPLSKRSAEKLEGLHQLAVCPRKKVHF